MAGAAIAVALILVVAMSIPVSHWASRFAASFRRRRAPNTSMAGLGALQGLRPGLATLLLAGRCTRALIDGLGPVAADYRRTLPYLNLFFADVRTGLDVRSTRWVVLARQDYELAVSDVARHLVRWHRALDKLDETERLVVDGAGGEPTSVRALLGDGMRLPRTPIEAQRLRFCEAWEVERLEDSLECIAQDLERFEQRMLEAHVGPYR